MEPTAKSLARTYSDRVYPDPWEKVLDYRRVQEYAAEHPSAGRVRVGRALDLPAERVTTADAALTISAAAARELGVE